MLLTLTFFTLALVLATLLPMWDNSHWIRPVHGFSPASIGDTGFSAAFFQLWSVDSGTWIPWLLIFIASGIAANVLMSEKIKTAA
jgi:hypothetical protein